MPTPAAVHWPRAGVAQLAEQPPCKRQVGGSIPPAGSTEGRRPGIVEGKVGEMRVRIGLVVILVVSTLLLLPVAGASARPSATLDPARLPVGVSGRPARQARIRHHPDPGPLQGLRRPAARALGRRSLGRAASRPGRHVLLPAARARPGSGFLRGDERQPPLAPGESGARRRGGHLRDRRAEQRERPRALPQRRHASGAHGRSLRQRRPLAGADRSVSTVPRGRSTR